MSQEKEAIVELVEIQQDSDATENAKHSEITVCDKEIKDKEIGNDPTTENIPKETLNINNTVKNEDNKTIRVDIKLEDFSSANGALKEGIESYYKCVKKSMPDLPALDLILENYSYSASLPNTKKNEATGLLTVIKNSLKYITFQTSYRKKIILNRLNLCFAAGSNTIILGTPGCGTTSLLDALGGRNNNGKVEGVCQYGGKNISDYKWNRLAIVCEQLDNHYPSQTVKSTMNFSKMCLSGPKSFYKDTEVEDIYMKDIDLKSDIIIKTLGLSICAETIVGDSLTRGVSGGERRRVTLGEILLGPQRVILLDKFSTGLDSAVTIDIVRMLNTWAKTFNGIVVAAMLQPDPEMLDLYDQLILLEKGNVTYAGPTKDCLLYLESFGYKMPEDKDVGSFISEMGCISFREDCSPGNKIQTTEEMRNNYEESSYFKQQQEMIYKSMNKNQELFTTKYAKKVYDNNYCENFFEMFWTVFVQQCKLLYSDKVYVFGRLLEKIVLGVIIACMFIDIPRDQPIMKCIYLFFYIIFASFCHISNAGVAVRQKPVMNKQYRKGYFSSVCYILSTILCQYPLIIIESLLIAVPLYYIVGLTNVDNSAHFWIYYVAGVVTSIAMLSIVRFVIMIIDSESVNTGIMPLILFLFGNTCGITKKISDMPWVLRWVYYINPFSYANKIIVTNEYYSGEYNDMPSGWAEAYLDTLGFPKTDDDMYLWFIALIIIHIVFTIGAILVMRFKPIKTTVSYVVDDDEVKKMNEKVRQESLNQIRSSRGSLTLQQITLSFKNLCYYVKVKEKLTKKSEERQLLDNISGFIRPNTMTALMGSSGAGKTTLLDVLAGKKRSGRITGKILFNGQELDAISLSHYLGYVEQMDNLPSKDTVYEALEFSAKMRLPSGTSDSMIRKVVKETLVLLNLEKYSDLMIGTPGDGLSMAIRKLVMTGIELVANPPIIFLDEPTTGLDSNSALLVVQVLERVAATGRSVICTIHQPSFEIFKMFTDILLLERGGRMIYLGPMGENSKDLVKFLEGHPDVPKLPLHTNPAAWMLEVTGGGVNKARTEMSGFYLNSELYKQNMITIENIENNISNKIPKLQRYMSSFSNQLKCTFGRISRFYWRSADIIFPRIGICALIGLLMGIMYWNSHPDSITGLQSIMSSMFITSMFTAIYATVTCLPGLFHERAVVYREIDMNYVKPSSYLIAYTVCEIPLCIVTALLSTVFLYPMCNYKSDAESVFLFIIAFIMLIIFAVYLGQVLVYCFPTLQIAILGGVAIIAILAVLSGFAIKYDDLFILFKIIYWIDPIQYFFNGVSASQCHCEDGINCPLIDIPGTNTKIPVNMYIDSANGLKYDRRWTAIAGTFVWCVLLKIPLMYGMKKIRFITV